MTETPTAAAGSPRVLVIGEGRLADATERALRSRIATVRHLDGGSDREIGEAVASGVDRVVLVSRFDHVSLRLALLVAHVRPDLELLVTIFDRDVAAQLQQAAPHVHVLSMADVVAPTFAGPCLDQQLLSVVLGTPSGVEGVRAVDGAPERVRPTWSTPTRAGRAAAGVQALANPFDPGARILVGGVAGVVAVFVADVLVTMLAEGFSFPDAVYGVAKVTVTSGPNPAAERAGDGIQLLSAAFMVLSLGFIALLTAGLVNRLLDPRLTALTGRAAVPRRDHVIVVGLGQVGLRLCGLLRELGIPVVAVEQNPQAKNIPRARDQRLPIIVGSGSSHRLLRRLSVHRARALVAVTSDEIENIAVAVAARSVCADLHLTFRAGDGDLASDTRSLFKVGVVRDVYSIAGAALAAAALGREVQAAFPHEGELYLVDRAGTISGFAAGTADPPD